MATRSQGNKLKAIGKRSAAIAAAATVGLSLGVAQPTAANAASCASPEVCTWSGTNYTGNVGYSYASPGVCYYNAGPIRSVINRTSRTITFYELSNCAISGFSTRTVGAGLSVSNLGITAYSYKAS
ncbi:peptidase inhibitor family I36 protein [Micromonospora solifontis]|uniref:Peptidase inhibitor family I36 n=1 Tax=Micromonospora solifontis TaxID=2487138 RepID=A0ABX9WDK0_9ACTN|nr:peptidase inhibitor family I36 protein [Micromonospora sp. PPF5-17B]NES39108.1 peptidase inhibitor family I36 protein [Micromonospora solifontis]NES57891.1 peptidase inhibitor family I36 protein [Micromonospora sp. PPF5-6]RNL91008.1 hypothetical protein EFE23_23700 [Micromonospora solifontis]